MSEENKVELKDYPVEYEFNGETFKLTIQAKNTEEAITKLAVMKATACITGEPA